MPHRGALRWRQLTAQSWRDSSVATGNLPDEAFYAYAEAEINLPNNGGRLRWRAVTEAAWQGEEVRNTEQMTFTRVQLTGSKIAAKYRGTSLTAATPYGKMTAAVDAKGNLARVRKESIAGTPDNEFSRPLADVNYGPNFLRWNGGAPKGFLGNPEEDHTVTGGRGNVNSVTIHAGKNTNGTIITSTNQFSVAGQLYTGA